jgi:putative membrane protein
MPSFSLIMSSFALFLLTGLQMAPAQQLSTQDKEFIKAAGSGSMLEVRLGQYASQNAAAKDVKLFAEHMVDDHSKANEQLHTLATQEPIEIPRALSDDDNKTLERLEKLTGAEFDKAYVSQMVGDHEKDVAAFEKEMSDGSDVSVKAFAEKILPVIKHHLEMAKNLDKSINH